MKCREMHGHIRPELLNHPCRHRLEFGVRVIFPRDEQRGKFQPGIGFVLHIFERFENRSEMTAADLVIKAFGERLEIYVGGIHRGKELGSGLRIHVVGGHGNSLNARVATCGHNVQRILEKNDRVFIGGSNAPSGRA